MKATAKKSGAIRSAKLFKHGGSQAVRLPKEFRFKADEVIISRQGDAVILRPRKKMKLGDRFKLASEMVTADFMEKRQQPKEQQVRDWF
jgi:antitoxin VapB